jgi:hypothetical protein
MIKQNQKFRNQNPPPPDQSVPREPSQPVETHHVFRSRVDGTQGFNPTGPRLDRHRPNPVETRKKLHAPAIIKELRILARAIAFPKKMV